MASYCHRIIPTQASFASVLRSLPFRFQHSRNASIYSLIRTWAALNCSAQSHLLLTHPPVLFLVVAIGHFCIFICSTISTAEFLIEERTVLTCATCTKYPFVPVPAVRRCAAYGCGVGKTNHPAPHRLPPFFYHSRSHFHQT
jgi:hypothetical protein